ncbi:MAG: hypothetical protein PHE55_14230 [Methylococcaceae bacterium]|nr:hypothetical protein [Methylococcaceae bacterium]
MQTFTFECNLDSTRHLVLDLPPSVPLGRHRVAVVIDPPLIEQAAAPIQPIADEQPARTERWQHLMALREQAIAEGMQLMDWDEINAEVRSRRGGASDE